MKVKGHAKKARTMKARTMKRHRLFALLLAAAAIGSGSIVHAQAARPSAEAQKEYDQFIPKFRAALKANNSAAVAELTKFPFQGDKAQDAQLFQKKTYGELFPAKVRNCIARGKATYDRSPNGEENFIIFCNETLFMFTRTPDGIRFADVSPND